ncbi:MAG: hypothetical protein JJU13_16010 [Balneolaceae bacterium]|nr:hypothetical protein [Balneolaceae bacterium]
MKILYGIQGTGHGHISRAREILPLLAEKADVDVLISGYNCRMNLDGVKVNHKRGISLAYDSNGSVSYLKTALSIKPVTFLQDVHSLDVKSYDLVVSDYEPVSAWASAGSRVPSIALSHQASFLSNRTPRPKHKSLLAEQILKNFAPCSHSVGFHFRRYDSFIQPPIVRQEVLDMESGIGSHVTVYLPAFDHEQLVSHFMKLSKTEWHIFSPSCTEVYVEKNIIVNPVANLPFLKSLKTSKGVITSAGFETCAEAMFLGKKLMVIPIRNQYEQLCNAAALKQLGIHVIKKLDGSFDYQVRDWIENASVVHLPEVADTDRLTTKIVRFARKLRKKETQFVNTAANF